MTTHPPRRFRVQPGRHVVLPVNIKAGPGATNMRYEPDSEFELEHERCRRGQRYLANRIAMGDLVEITGTSTAELAAPQLVAHVTPSSSPPREMTVTTGAPPTAEPSKES